MTTLNITNFSVQKSSAVNIPYNDALLHSFGRSLCYMIQKVVNHQENRLRTYYHK